MKNKAQKEKMVQPLQVTFDETQRDLEARNADGKLTNIILTVSLVRYKRKNRIIFEININGNIK